MSMSSRARGENPAPRLTMVMLPEIRPASVLTELLMKCFRFTIASEYQGQMRLYRSNISFPADRSSLWRYSAIRGSSR